MDAALADGGPLARAIDQFEPRQGQREMARGVADVLANGGVLLAEAGTGTGKTMAYLVPAILSRQRVLISTGTKNLQEQIYFKDLPVLQKALPVAFKATYMKGRANYLCLHRFDQLQAGGNQIVVEQIAAWVRSTETGDRAELEDLPEDSGLWSEVSATAETCLGGECPQFQQCFVTRMRQRAAESDVVIVNHHLLCADAAVRQSSYGEVIPDCRHVILDEAHQLEEIATQYFGLSVSNYRLDELLRDVERLLNAGVVDDQDGDARRAVSRVNDHGRAFFGGVALARRARGYASEERLRIGPDWFGDVVDHGRALITALDGLEAVMALAGGKADAPAHGRETNEDALTLARRAGEIRDNLRFLLSASDPTFVYFVELRGRGVFLRAAPIDVSAIIQELLLDRLRSTVLTSATLAVAGSFDYVRDRLGIRRPRSCACRPSSISRRRACSICRGGCHRRSRRSSPARCRGKSRRSCGAPTDARSCSSPATRRCTPCYETVMGTVPYPLLVQGTAPRSALLKQFRSTPHAVLFATSSFWQGVDVVGEQLSCVIIDKLPFASPGDPITAARIEHINAMGGDAFNEYQVPLAILTLLQGLGRLIRHRTDRGILAVLDPRLRTMGYGRRFLESFPPAPIAQELGAIERFFRMT